MLKWLDENQTRLLAYGYVIERHNFARAGLTDDVLATLDIEEYEKQEDVVEASDIADLLEAKGVINASDVDSLKAKKKKGKKKVAKKVAKKTVAKKSKKKV